jgi:class 3 adenylate cyclase/tetratricopeptide (TPR) repeat protein
MDAARKCEQCGQEVSEQARFCEQCGMPLQLISGERKQVTVMFVDVVRSMELTRALGAERWREVLDGFLAIARGAIDELGGTVNQFHGDGLLAVFGAPLADEDHARRACLAALELRGRIATFAEALERSDGVEFSTRCGLGSGEVIVGSIGEGLRMDFAPIGNTGGLGKRIESLAPDGSAALSASTAALVEGEFELRALGEFELKGLDGRQRVYELLGPSAAHTRLEAADPSRLSRFVGREAERAVLATALERALEGEGGTVAIRGEPGVGKSRLLHEFARECRERGLRVELVRAFAHGRAVPLRPVLGMLRSFFGVKEGDEPALARERIEAAALEIDLDFGRDLALLFDFLGLADPERPLERIDPEARQRRLRALVSQLMVARSRREPTAILIEDLHWLDAASAAFVEELVGAAAGTRTSIVATFRPEYQAGWIGPPAAEELSLQPLDAESAVELLDELLGDDPSLGGLTEKLLARTGGNPFFIEETVQALYETGHLAGERGAFDLADPGGEVVLPATVQAVLGARIDRLGTGEKAVLQTMAVIGKRADRGVLGEVMGLEPARLGRALEALAGAEFLVEEGEGALVFKHPLTQEVAYSSQLSEPRARLHTAVAAAIERTYPQGLDERAALLAHHSEAAGDLLPAARWHARAATWVWVNSPGEGMRHWQRVRELADGLADSPEGEQLAVLASISILALAWRVGVSPEEAAVIHEEGRGLLEQARPAVARPQELLLDLAYSGNMFFGGREHESVAFSARAVEIADEIGDPGLVLNANCYASVAALTVGALRESIELVDRAVALAGDDYGAGSGLITGTPYAHCLWTRGSAQVMMGLFERSFRDFNRSLEIAAEFGDTLCELTALTMRALAYSETFEAERGLVDAERAVELVDWIGDGQASFSCRFALAHMLNECGDFEAGREVAELTLGQIRERGTGVTIEAEVLGVLAVARMGIGDLDSAWAAVEQGIAIAEGRRLKRPVVRLKWALGRVLLRIDGAADAAELALQQALAIAAELEYRGIEPHIRLELAELARLRDDEAVAAHEEATVEQLLAEFRDPGASLAARPAQLLGN